MAAPYVYPGAPDDIRGIIAAYEGQIAELGSLVRGMSPEQLRARPVAGRWSTLELLCHLADCEQVMADRIKRAASMKNALLMGFDETRYASELAYADREPAEELELIRLTRRQAARIMRHLKGDAWQQTAVHSERGLFTLKELAQYPIGHMSHHLPFLKEKRVAMGLK